MRATAKLSGKLERGLIAYATAANAAGAGLLAMSQMADAKVVYTPTHQVIERKQFYNLDLNNDGATDFVIAETSDSSQFWATSLHVSTRRGKVAVVPTATHFAAAFKRGQTIGPRKVFATRGTYKEMAAVGTFTTTSRVWVSGEWVNVRKHYLGLKFEINGQTHYGWARMSVAVDDQRMRITATLTGYAYETIPDKPIIAGNRGSTTGQGPQAEPAGLGQLALGAAGRSNRH